MRSREEVLREFAQEWCVSDDDELDEVVERFSAMLRELEAPRGEAVACAEAFHVAEYIEEEMRERDWSRDELATRMMPPDKLDPLDHEAWGITRLALDLLLDVTVHLNAHNRDVPLLRTRAERAEANERRYLWLKERFHGVDWDYDTAQPRISVLTFKVPDDMSVSANLDATIDAALSTPTGQGAA